MKLTPEIIKMGGIVDLKLPCFKKTLFIAIIVLTAFGCNKGQQNTDKGNTKVNASTSTETVKTVLPDSTLLFRKQELVSFLDSIGQLSPDRWLGQATVHIDSIFTNTQNLGIILSPSDFLALKQGCISGRLDIAITKRIFPNLKINNSYFAKSIIEGFLPIKFFPCDESDNTFINFAVCPGYDNGFSASSDVYFFISNKLIAKRTNCHRYGLDLKHFRDKDGRMVVYYKEYSETGTGMSCCNYFFYKFIEGGLIPILYELQQAHFQFGWATRKYLLESDILNTDPLTLNMAYSVDLRPAHDTIGVQIIRGFAVIMYKWNEDLKRFTGEYLNAGISKKQILSSYHADNELLFMNIYYKDLKNILSNGDDVKQKVTLDYLNIVNNHYRRSSTKK